MNFVVFMSSSYSNTSPCHSSELMRLAYCNISPSSHRLPSSACSACSRNSLSSRLKPLLTLLYTALLPALRSSHPQLCGPPAQLVSVFSFTNPLPKHLHRNHATQVPVQHGRNFRRGELLYCSLCYQSKRRCTMNVWVSALLEQASVIVDRQTFTDSSVAAPQKHDIKLLKSLASDFDVNLSYTACVFIWCFDSF
ncbi:hypothetical protein BDR05DRAFT_636193 [Suillus weaverae]|nr:hypothetical protein BDR05DRAFT_636193 [Suillus weaverae]